MSEPLAQTNPASKGKIDPESVALQALRAREKRLHSLQAEQQRFKDSERPELELLQLEAIARAKGKSHAGYDELMAKSRELAASGDKDSARRVAEIALKRRRADRKSLGTQVEEFFLGDNDPATQNFGEKIGTALNTAGESLTFGLIGDETSARVEEALGLGRYADRRDHYRDQERQFAKEHPVAHVASQVAPALIPGLGAASLAAKVPTVAGKAAATGLMGAAAGGTYGFMEGVGGLDERLDGAQSGATVGGLIGAASVPVSRAVGGIVRGRQAKKAAKAFIDDAPTVDDLTAQASVKYNDAARKGLTAGSNSTTELAGRLTGIVRSEGLISPKGRVSSAYPKVKDALSLIEDYTGASMTPEQMMQVRKLLQGAARSVDKQEGRIGTFLLKGFDDWVEPLAPEFRDANALYTRAMRGNMIDEAIELAGSRAGQFSGSGFENALRTEFRALERKIIKGQIKGLTDEQVAAIGRVARGGSVENFLRGLGKAAPTSVVSAATGGGVPFLVGNAIGGPGVGAAAGAGTMAAGALARRAATRRQTNNAAVASAIMRAVRGVPEASGHRYSPVAQGLLFGTIPAVGGP